MFSFLKPAPTPPVASYRLAKASFSEIKVAAHNGLPLEGRLYDSLSLTNFVDVENHALTASISKTVSCNTLSDVLDADLPARLTLTAKPGTLSVDGPKWQPAGKLGLSVRLLDLGTSDDRQKGYLKLKMALRTDGRRDHGFEIDRKVQLFGLDNTTVYGNATYKTNNKADEWKTTSSFGLHQDFRLGGISFAGRVGLTPEGDFVYDLKL